MWGLGGLNDFSPAEPVLGFVFRHRTSVLESGDNIRAFDNREKTRPFRRTKKKQNRDHSKNNGKYAFLPW